MPSSPDSQVTQSVPREAREAIKALFDALSEWRDEVGASTERYSETVLDKMAAAARALGWPTELVDASHKHLAQASKTQMHMIDQLMDAWEKQLTSPTSDQFMAQLRTFPSAGFGRRQSISGCKQPRCGGAIWNRLCRCGPIRLRVHARINVGIS